MEESTRNFHLRVLTQQDTERTRARNMYAIEIEVDGVIVSLDIRSVTVNGNEANLPFVSEVVYIKQATSIFKMVKVFGMTILYDGNQRLYITAQPFYDNKVSMLILK